MGCKLVVKQLTTINMPEQDGVYGEFYPIVKEKLIGVLCNNL